MTTVLGATENDTPTQACSRCFASDHSVSECALALWEAAVTPASLPLSAQSLGRNAVNLNSSLKPSRPKPYQDPSNYCRRFNRGMCKTVPCRFGHKCNNCHQGSHGASSSPKIKNRPTAVGSPSLGIRLTSRGILPLWTQISRTISARQLSLLSNVFNPYSAVQCIYSLLKLIMLINLLRGTCSVLSPWVIIKNP